MTDSYNDPATGLPMTLPDAPGDYSETVIRKEPIQYDDYGHPITPESAAPFAPLTPQQATEERARLNMKAAGRGTLAGSSSVAQARSEAQLPTPGPDVPKEVIDHAGGFPFEHDGKMYVPEQEKLAAQDHLEDVQADILAYNGMRPYKGFTEGAASLAGQTVGAMSSPENLAFPELKIGTAAWYAKNPVMGMILAQGFGQAATSAGADPLVQANEVRASLKKQYSFADTLVAIPTGFALGAGIPATVIGGSKIFKNGWEAIAGRLRGEAPVLAPEIRPPVPPEPPSITPDPGFEQGGGQTQAVVNKAGVPTGETRPEPLVGEGNVRLYHKDKPGQPLKDAETFTFQPEEGTTSYIDLPERAVEGLRDGSNVSLPRDMTEQRQPLPSISTPETIAERIAAREAEAAPAPSRSELRAKQREVDAAAELKIARESAPETGQTLTQFINSKGGLKPSPELDAIYGQKRPDLIRKDGMTLDQAREALVEARYFRDEGIESGGTASTTPNDVLRRLQDEDKGLKHYQEGKGPPRQADVRMSEIEHDVYATMQEWGHDPTATENRAVYRDAANRAYQDGLSVEDALERAMKDAGDRQRGARIAPEEDVPFTRPKGIVGSSVAPAPGTHRPAAGVAGAPDKPGVREAANLNGAMHSIARALGLEVREGVYVRGAAGTLHGNLVRILERGVDGYITLTHEIGHVVEERIGGPIQALILKHMNGMKAFAGPRAAGDPIAIAREGWAEFIAQYASERDMAKIKDPNLVREFRTLMENHSPESRKLLEQIDRGYAAYQAYEAAPSTRVVTSMIVSDAGVRSNKERDPLNRNAFKLWFDNRYKNWINQQDPLNNVVKYVLKKWSEANQGKLYPLTPDKDPRSVFQVLRNGSQTLSLQEMHGGILDRMNNRTSPGIISIGERVTADPITGAVAPDLATVAVRKRDFSAYAVAHFHQDLRAQMKRGEIELSRPPTGMTDGDAAQTIKEMEKAYPNFPALIEELYAYRDALRKKRLDSGLITIDEFQDLMHEKNRRYVPFYRDMSTLTEGGGGGRAMGGSGKKGLEDISDPARQGSTRDIRDVIESLMDQHFKINDQANYAKAVQTYRDFMRNVGGAEAGKFMEEIPAKEIRMQDIDVRRIIETSLKDAGYTPQDARDLASFHIADLGMEERIKLFQATDIKGAGRPILFGMEGGERYAIRLPDNTFGRDLQNALDFLGPLGTQTVGQAAGVLHSVLVGTAKTLRTGAVTTFTFAVKNMIRDAVGSFFYINGVRVPFETHVRGAWQMAAYHFYEKGYRKQVPFIGSGEALRRYREYGGLEGGGATAAFSKEARSQMSQQALHGGWRFDVAAEERRNYRAANGIQVSGVQLAMEALADSRKLLVDGLRKVVKLAEAGETANRVGIFDVVYKENIKQNRTPEFAGIDAAQKARDFTDFGRHGSRMELLTQTIPFLGASIQGTDKFIRTAGQALFADTLVRGPLTQFERASLNDLRKQLAWKLSSVAAAGVYLEYLYQDDPWYQNLPLQTKATNWNFKIHGVHVKIPKPFEWATLLNLAEQVFRYTNTGDNQHMFNWMKSIAYTHNMPSNFPIISTAIGLMSNYDTFFDRPITPGRQQHLYPHMQRLNDTAAIYVTLAELLHNNVWNSQDAHKTLTGWGPAGALLASAWAPVESQWVVSRMLGDWPRELGGILGMAKSLTTGDNLKMNDIPVLRTIIQEKLGMGEPIREIINQTNQHDGRLMRAQKTYDDFLKNGDAIGAQHFFDQLDTNQKDFVRLHLIDGGKIVNNMNPMARAKAIYTASATILSQLDSPNGIRSFINPTERIPLADNMKLPVQNLLTEFSANQARNTLIAMGIPGYKGQAMVPTQPDLDKLKVMAPEVHKELVTQLADARVLPWESVEKYWPQVQKLLAAGGDRKTLSIQARAIGLAAAAENKLEGGGIALKKGAIAEGTIVKRGGYKPGQIPATEGAMP
jgi:hypothetical protein